MKMTCCKGGETSHLGYAVKLDSEENACFLSGSLILLGFDKKSTSAMGGELHHVFSY